MSTLPTEPYKGTRDFYPSDMAIQHYIFDTWSKAAESFGYERYDASILEPSELYKSKGAENEEMVNEQTYTFIDRGEREVTLRPEMTPTVARMVAGRRRELTFPVRWYSIPNLFRYERPQRGRLREHWQLNCDLFGATHYAADVEVISLACHVLTAFGATKDMFQVRINDRALMRTWYTTALSLKDEDIRALTHIVDRRRKLSKGEFEAQLKTIPCDTEALMHGLDATDPTQLRDENRLSEVIKGLQALGITNVAFDPSIARGFNYYTGTIFEIFDTSGQNNRSMIGGGRYDNLTALFGGDPVSGIGFGMGDVVMRDFLETHRLLPPTLSTTPVLMVVPTDDSVAIEAEKVAQAFRDAHVSTAVDFGTKKLGKKLASASDQGVRFVLVVGDTEISSGRYTLKELATSGETSATLTELIERFT